MSRSVVTADMMPNCRVLAERPRIADDEMSKSTRDHLIDTAELTRAGGTLSGREPVARLTRLASMLDPDHPGDAIDWTLSGRREPQPDGGRQPWLTLHFAGEVGMVCTRCLQRVAVPLMADHRFLLVADEVLAARADAETDEYDVLVGSHRFDVLELVEDEVIMALPLVPRHDDCQLPDPPAQAGASAGSEGPRAERAAGGHAGSDTGQACADGDANEPNPFAVLRQWRRRQP